MKVDHNPTLQNNSQIALLSKTENTATHGSNTTTNKTQQDTATVQATPLELGELHKSENFKSNDLEQLKRLAQIRETLGKGGKDPKEDKKADALALDLLNTIKANLTPDEKNSSAKNQHLETLKTNIESKKYADAIKDVGQMMELFEMESRGAFTPVKNTKGGTVDTIFDTITSHVLGNVVGPGIVSLFKKLGHGPVEKTSLPENAKLAANLAVGGVGFYAAEESIGKFLDPQWKILFPKIRKFLDDKIPDALIKINQAGDKLIKQIIHGILGVFGKKLETSESKDFVNQDLEHRVIDYIKNKAEIDHKDEMHFPKLVREMLNDDYQRLYGKKMPLPVAKALDIAFACVDETSKTRLSLLANEAALVAKPLLDKFGPPGAAIYHFFFDVVPNAYIFVTRPIAMFAINLKEKELLDHANTLGIRLPEKGSANKH
ncbi:MAG: hypothetical protein EBR67_02810 [Proteobacteria bacterium]|nr:hypothetical protein [Pseudomonadota bacterium]